MFRLEHREVIALRSQIATSKEGKGGRRYLPYAFTEHGAVMAANVLNSKLAINASILLVRTFIKMRTMFAEHAELKRRMEYIERRLAEGFREYGQELQEIRFALAQLETPADSREKRIGFDPSGRIS